MSELQRVRDKIKVLEEKSRAAEEAGDNNALVLACQQQLVFLRQEETIIMRSAYSGEKLPRYR